MGISLMANRANNNKIHMAQTKKVISRRSWFLFVIGLLLYTWWPADILHYYGGYMHFALPLLFVPKKYYLWAAILAIVIFHTLLMVIPYQNGWNFNTLQYTDFWTVTGFLRNTFYNGWNAIFPWVAYFFMGMWLGKLNWANNKIQRNAFIVGVALVIGVTILQFYAAHSSLNANLIMYITADYLPPFLPFMCSTFGFALMLLAACMFVGNKIANTAFAKVLVVTGQSTLTHYIAHLTIGMLIFALLTGKSYAGTLSNTNPVAPSYILLFALVYYGISCVFSYYWAKKFKNGPLETLMRKISG
jgi:uncharacterized protein